MQAIKTIIGAISGLICPIALAILGYFVIFKELDWFYLIIILAVYIIGVIILLSATYKENRFPAYCEIMSGGFGWVWILSIIASIWFVILALFFGGSWWEFGYSFAVGSICKMWTRGFMQAKNEDIISKK